MDTRKKQRIASILIGAGLVILILAVGFQLIKQRSKAANSVNDFSCNCSENKCEVKLTGPCGPLSIQYNNFIADPVGNPESTDGLCQHQFKFTLFNTESIEPISIKVIKEDGTVESNPEWECVQSPSTPAVESEPTDTASETVDQPVTNVDVPNYSLPKTSDVVEQVLLLYTKSPDTSPNVCAALVKNFLMCYQLNPKRDSFNSLSSPPGVNSGPGN